MFLSQGVMRHNADYVTFLTTTLLSHFQLPWQHVICAGELCHFGICFVCDKQEKLTLAESNSCFQWL